MDKWKSRREEQKRKGQRRERVRRKKMQVREKVENSRNTVFFQWFVAPEGRKVGSLKEKLRVWSIFGRSDVVFACQAQGLYTLSKMSKMWGFCSSFSYNHHYTTLHSLHYTALHYSHNYNYNYKYHYITLYYTTLRYTNYITLHYTNYSTLHFTTLDSVTLHYS